MQIMTNFLTNAIKFSLPGGTVSILLKIIDVKPSENELNRIHTYNKHDSGLSGLINIYKEKEKPRKFPSFEN